MTQTPSPLRAEPGAGRGAPLTVPAMLAIARLVSRVGWQLIDLLLAQRRAKAGFRRGLRESGLSPQDVERLAPLFPILTPTQFLNSSD